MPRSTLIKYHGSKSYLSSWFASLAPPHIHRAYAYAGALNERVNWPAEGVSEVANDINGVLINFYRVLQSPKLFKEFERRISATPFSRIEWTHANTVLGDLEPIDYRPLKPDVENAALFFIWNRQSMAGRMDCFTPLTRKRTRGGRNAEVNSWWSAVEGLAEFKASLDDVVIEQVLATDFIRREDTEGTLTYCDPPYLSETRSVPSVFKCEMYKEEHETLLALLTSGKLKSKIMLSGYRSDLYDTCLKDWKRHEKAIDNKAAKGASKRRMTECLWTNF